MNYGPSRLSQQAFRQFQYLTVPLKVGSDYLQTALAQALRPALNAGSDTAAAES